MICENDLIMDSAGAHKHSHDLGQSLQVKESISRKTLTGETVLSKCPNAALGADILELLISTLWEVGNIEDKDYIPSIKNP